ncbi:MAG: sigma-70 family RNA polymerase sigma factor [Planctomycetota bacterium]
MARPQRSFQGLGAVRRVPLDLEDLLGADLSSARAAPAEEVSDADLVHAALDGDEEAFGQLVARYHRRAFWIAFHVVGRVEDARDVVQESFVRVHRALNNFDFGRSFYTWFYRIVMNLAIDSLRKRRAARAVSVDEFVDRLAAEEGATEPAERDETRTLVWRVLGKLDSKFRSVMVLRDIHGMSCREIAPILQVTHATVRWRLHRARQIFREHWERMVKEDRD